MMYGGQEKCDDADGGECMFGRKKNRDTEKKQYDAAVCKPVLRCSICTGEQVAGFQDLRTGRFEEVELIRNDRELQDFLDRYGLKDIEKIY